VVDDGTGIGADTPAVIGSQEGEIGDAAVVGTWTTRFIGIQNLGTSQASVNLDLRTHSQVSNAIAQTIGSKTIFKDGSIVILPGEITSAGSYGGVLSSDQSLAAAVLNDNNTYGTADLYLGTATPSQKVNLPKVFRHHFGITSKFAIQNAYSSAQDITVKAYAIGNGSPVATKTYSNVPANAAFVIDFANDSDYAALTAGDNTGSGAATVEGSAGPVAVVVDSIQDQDSLTGDQKQYYYNGIPDSDAGTVLIHAKAFSNHFGLFSGVAVSNITANTTNVTVKFITDGLGTATSAPKQLLAYESKSFFLPSESVPQGNGASGSIVITSDNSTANIVAVITSARDATSGGTGSQTPAISQDALSITKNIAVPLVFGTSINSWQTGVGVYAVDAGTISATFVKGGVDPTVAGNFFSYNNGAIGAGQITNFYVPGLAGFDQSLTGAVFIQSTGRIIALTTYDMGDSLGSMPGQNY